MKTATLFELGKALVCGIAYMVGNLFRVLCGRGSGHVVLTVKGAEASYRSTPFWIPRRQGF